MSQISRRDFLKVLGTATLSPFVHLPPPTQASPANQAEAARGVQARKIYLITVDIAGFYFYDGMEEEVYERLAPGDELELRREPDNPHDTNAIEVYTQDGIKLGYVPRISNPIPAAIADQDIAIGAEIADMELYPEEYPPVRMRLYMVVLTEADPE